jgi:hypothetical protein
MDENLNLEGNVEIKKALEEFGAKSAQENTGQNAGASRVLEVPKHEVEGVKFETDNYKAVKFYEETTAPKMIKSVMKLSGGIIKEERQAEYVLLVFVVIALAISVFLFWRGKSDTLQFDIKNIDQSQYSSFK